MFKNLGQINWDTVFVLLFFAGTMLLLLDIAQNITKWETESRNRKVLTYEVNQYCQPTSGGVTVKVINPKGRYDANESVQEQWIPLEKLAISASQTEEARLMTLEDETYRLELPTAGVCQRTESAPALAE